MIATVFGATGNQGRQVCRYLLEHSFTVRSVTRNPNASIVPGTSLFRCNLDNADLITTALTDAAFVFCVYPETWNDDELIAKAFSSFL